jgi:sterol desaturase/sphingolipid hydroxylase (fatty acid hydroxylase superfamily)
MQSIAEFFFEDMTFNGGLYALFAVPSFLIVWVALAGRLQHRRIQPLRRARARDMVHDAAYSLLSLVVFAALDYAILKLEEQGLTLLYTDPRRFGLAWLLGSVPVLIVLHDTYFYWMHRLAHHPAVYPSVHRVHHRSTDPSPFTSFAFHPLEAVLENLFPLLAVLVLPLHLWAIIAWQVFQQAFNVIGHLGYELYPRWWLRAPLLRWKTTSTHHNLHHEKFLGNYGLYFTWWDRLLGTEFSQYEARFLAATQPAPAGRSLTGAPT